MSADEFRKLALDFAQVKSEDLLGVSFREHYGFVDVKEGSAKLLIENLNGIEYNGHPLVVERAASLSERPRRANNNRGNNRGGNNRDQNGGGYGRGRRDDNQRNNQRPDNRRNDNRNR